MIGFDLHVKVNCMWLITECTRVGCDNTVAYHFIVSRASSHVQEPNIATPPGLLLFFSLWVNLRASLAGFLNELQIRLHAKLWQMECSPTAPPKKSFKTRFFKVILKHVV